MAAAQAQAQAQTQAQTKAKAQSTAVWMLLFVFAFGCGASFVSVLTNGQPSLPLCHSPPPFLSRFGRDKFTCQTYQRLVNIYD